MAQEKTMLKKSFHQKTGHATNAYLQDTAKYSGIELSGTIPTCVSCSIEKIRQKNIPKDNANKRTMHGDQMYLDISSMVQARSGGNKHWALMVDEATKYKKSFFLKRKNDQVEVIIDWLKELKNKYKIKVQRIRIDNAGENKMLVKSCDQNEMGIKLEYTAPVTPQQNGVVERAFVTPIGRGRAMMNHARFTVKERQEMWCEAAQTVTMLDNVLVQGKGDKPPHTKLYSEDPKYAKYVRTFGEIGVTAISSNKVARTKLDPRGRISLFVKNSLNHLADTHHFINLSTKIVIHSRDEQDMGSILYNTNKGYGTIRNRN